MTASSWQAGPRSSPRGPSTCPTRSRDARVLRTRDWSRPDCRYPNGANGQLYADFREHLKYYLRGAIYLPARCLASLGALPRGPEINCLQLAPGGRSCLARRSPLGKLAIEFADLTLLARDSALVLSYPRTRRGCAQLSSAPLCTRQRARRTSCAPKAAERRRCAPARERTTAPCQAAGPRAPPATPPQPRGRGWSG